VFFIYFSCFVFFVVDQGPVEALTPLPEALSKFLAQVTLFIAFLENVF
jgi:hypothetical protein